MEALILYFVLFFPSFSSGLSGGISQTDAISFSIFRELGRTLTYTIPSLALLWYLILDIKSSDLKPGGKKGLVALRFEMPGWHRIFSRDLVSFIIGLPGLFLIGLGISLLISFFPDFLGLPPPPKVEGPATIAGWIVMVFSCLGTGYLEESYFRYYLITKLDYQLPQTALRIALSTVLFSVCHFYEGPWGILNAVLAGVFLSVLFFRYRSLHGIAWAHGAYNILVYAMGNFSA